MSPDELRSRFMSAESLAEESAVFDAAVAELKRMGERAIKANVHHGNLPLDVKQLRGRFINAASPIDSAISFDSIIFEIEQLAQRLPTEQGKGQPITPRPILLQTQNPEELKHFVETLANERDLYRKKLEEAIAEHSKLKRLLEDLTRDRVANLNQAGQTMQLKREISQLKSQPLKERQALEQLSSDHEQMRREALVTQQERDQLKEQTQQLSGEIEQFRKLAAQLSSSQQPGAPKPEKLQQERDQPKEPTPPPSGEPDKRPPEQAPPKDETQQLSGEVQQFRELITQLSQKQSSAASKQEKLLDENFVLKYDMFKQALIQLENLESRLARLRKARKYPSRG